VAANDLSGSRLFVRIQRNHAARALLANELTHRGKLTSGQPVNSVRFRASANGAQMEDAAKRLKKIADILGSQS
jgi:hypothetical protein